MISEAHHYTLFLKFARNFGNNEKVVNEKWNALLDFEAEMMKKLSKDKLFMACAFLYIVCTCI